MKTIKKNKYDNQKVIRSSIIILISTIWIFSLIFLGNIINNINIPLVILFIMLLILGSILKYINISKNSLNEIRNYYVIEITLLIFSAYLMISNYTIYSFWNIIFSVVHPSFIVGFCFIASFTIGLFLPNKFARLVLIPLIFIYPIQFLNISSKWMIYGSLVSSICLIEIIYGVLNNLNEQRHRIEELNSTIMVILLKIILPILVISILLFFFLGHEKLASFSNVIYIKKWKVVILLLPLLIFIILLIISINLKISTLIFLIGNVITTLSLKDFSNSTDYNNFDFLFTSLNMDFSSNFELLIIILLHAITGGMLISSINYAYTEWKIYNINFKVLKDIDTNINKFKKNNSYAIKFFILKSSFLEAFYLSENRINLAPFLNVTKGFEQELLYKHLISINLKNSIMFLLPFNTFLTSIFIVYGFQNENNWKIISNYYSGCLTLYINILFSLVLIFWDKLQLKYLGKWFYKKQNLPIKNKKTHKSNKFGKKAK
ncbi:hypothetical protein [Spiroplasma endosymbiont of Cantharis rufa]|uniref:hypothetical protein n=1 Tax=Spiroplasma endosymbiont of Cantharis rufa TaxID=3066279 RepID=UPI0030CC1074